jgi:16S rRNA (guanine527-N7)-methyltransferase
MIVNLMESPLIWRQPIKGGNAVQGADIIFKYFPGLTDRQREQFTRLGPLYGEWNEKINVVSRKDIENLYVHHVLHSLGIAKVIAFRPGARVLDVGTGGGFPGIPLAILFPEAHFHLVDSIGKKITVVEALANSLALVNVTAEKARAEELKGTYDFIVSRAVTRLKEFTGWVKGRVKKESVHELPNGILYLKGGDLAGELTELNKPYRLFNLSDYFEEEFFETKKVVYVESV